MITTLQDELCTDVTTKDTFTTSIGRYNQMLCAKKGACRRRGKKSTCSHGIQHVTIRSIHEKLQQKKHAGKGTL